MGWLSFRPDLYGASLVSPASKKAISSANRFGVILLDAERSGVSNWRECLFSLMAQSRTGLELVVVLDRDAHRHAPEIESELERQAPAGGHRFHLLCSPHDAGAFPGLVLEGLAALRSGPAVILGSDAVVYPEHLVRLERALENAPSGWAWTRTKVASARRLPNGEIYLEGKRGNPPGQAFDPCALLFHRSSLYGAASSIRIWREAASRLAEDARSEQLVWELSRLGMPAYCADPPSVERRVLPSDPDWLESEGTEGLRLMAERLGTYPEHPLKISARDLVLWGAEIEKRTARMGGLVAEALTLGSRTLRSRLPRLHGWLFAALWGARERARSSHADSD